MLTRYILKNNLFQSVTSSILCFFIYLHIYAHKIIGELASYIRKKKQIKTNIQYPLFDTLIYNLQRTVAKPLKKQFRTLKFIFVTLIAYAH